jgi:hypothetical protein
MKATKLIKWKYSKAKIEEIKIRHWTRRNLDCRCMKLAPDEINHFCLLHPTISGLPIDMNKESFQSMLAICPWIDIDPLFLNNFNVCPYFHE